MATNEATGQDTRQLYRERLKNTTEIAKLMSEKKFTSTEQCSSVDDFRYGFSIRDQLIECLQRENRCLRDENAHLSKCLERNHETPGRPLRSMPRTGSQQKGTSAKYCGQPLIRNNADSIPSVELSAHYLAGTPITNMKSNRENRPLNTADTRSFGSGPRLRDNTERNTAEGMSVNNGGTSSRVVTCYVVELLRQPLMSLLFRGFLESVSGTMLHDHDTKLIFEPYPPWNDPRTRLAKHRPVVIPCLGTSNLETDIDTALQSSGVTNTKNIVLVVFHGNPRHAHEMKGPASRTLVSRRLCGAVRLITDVIYVEGFEVLPGVFPCRHNDGALTDVAHFFNS